MTADRRECGKRGDWDHDWKGIALGVSWCQECGMVGFTGAKDYLVPRLTQDMKPIIVEETNEKVH